MKNVVVREAQVTAQTGDWKRGSKFLVWRLIADSGIGIEEVHFTNLMGDEPIDPPPENTFEIVSNSFEVRVMATTDGP